MIRSSITPLLVEHAGVQRLARLLQLVDRVGDQPAQEITHLRPVQVDHGHVRDVEHAGIAAHLVVLLDLRTVVERHVPAAEVDHLRAEGAVGVVEYRLAGHSGLVGGREHHYPRAAQRHGEAASIRNGAADRTLAAEPFPHGSAAPAATRTRYFTSGTTPLAGALSVTSASRHSGFQGSSMPL